MACKDHSRNECVLYWETVVSGKWWKEGELWPGGRHHVGQVDRPIPDVVRMAQEADLAPKAATVTDREAMGDASMRSARWVARWCVSCWRVARRSTNRLTGAVKVRGRCRLGQGIG